MVLIAVITWTQDASWLAKKSLTFGTREPLTDGDVLAKLKLWLLIGLDAPVDCAAPRAWHVHSREHRDVRSLPVHSVAVLDQMLRDRGFEP
jgi:hypothetical protein